MKGELIPALVAIGGGSSAMAAILYQERRRTEAMRASRERFGIRFPVGLEVTSAQAVMGALAGLRHSSELVLEVAATEHGASHAIMVPRSDVTAVRAALGGAAKHLELRDGDAPTGRAAMTLRIFVPRLVALRVTELEAAGRSLLAGLAALGGGEQVVIRWAIRPGDAPGLPQPSESTPASRATEQAWRQKTATHGFNARGLVLVHAGSQARARVLVEMIAGLYRARSARGRLRTTLNPRGGSLTALPQIGRTDGWLNTSEILGLVAWPVGDVAPPGVELGAARSIRAPRDVHRSGRFLFTGHDARGERDVALSPEAARHHVAVVGASGTGKSSLLARGILDDIAAGHAGAVIDPQNDIVSAVLDRVRDKDADRIVVLDAARPGPVPGLALLSAGDVELRSDVIVSALRSIFASAWAIRSDLYVRAAVRTLADVPGARLADMGRLFFDARWRHSVIGQLRDPMLSAIWRQYEQLSVGEQVQHVQAPMTKIMALLSRPTVRAVLSSREPKLDLPRLLDERKWLMVPASAGLLGEPASRLIGASVMFCLWAAIEARAGVPPEQRHFVSVVLDEYATLSHGVPFNFETLSERARGLGAGLSVGVQSVARLPDSVRVALLANTASLISFRAGADDAVRLAKELPGIAPDDLKHLGRFEVAARVGLGAGSTVAIMTGRTEPLPEPTGQADRIRQLSTERYGSPPETDDLMPDRPDANEPDRSIGRRRRAS